MNEPITREQFATALADAVTGVLNVYREVDAMFRDLSAVLADGEPSLVPLIKRMVPGAGSKNPDARYLRNYQAALFAPSDAAEDDDDEEDDDDGGEEDLEDDEETPKKSKRHLELKVGSSIVVARAAIYDRSRSSFEPSLTVSVLSRCRPDGNVQAGAVLRTRPGRFKRLFRAIDAQRVAGKPLQTTVTAQVLGQGAKNKNQKLIFDEITPMRSYPLFEVTSDKLHEIVATLRSDWATSNASPK